MKKEASKASKRNEMTDEQRQRALDLKRFERKKRKISQRMQTVKELEQMRNTVGSSLGGQWIDQKWVPSAGLGVKASENFSTREFIIEIGLYLLFLVAFTWLVFSGRSNRTLVLYEKLWRQIVHSRLGHVRTPDEIFVGLQGLLLHDLDNSTQTRAYLAGYIASDIPAGVLGSTPIGEIRLRQGLVRGGINCYPPWTKKNEEKFYEKSQGVAGDRGKAEWYTRIEALEISSRIIKGRYGDYPGGGFVAKWPLPDSRENIKILQNSHWVDLKTRALVLDFAFFNTDQALFLSTECLFEFPGHGAVEPRISVNAVALIRYPVTGLWDLVRIGVMCFVYLMVAYYILDDVEYCRKKGLAKYRTFGWPHIDVMNICLFVVSGGWKVANQVLVMLAIPEDSSDEVVLARVRATAESLQNEDYIVGFNGLLLWIKLFKYISITRPMVRVLQAMAKCVKDIASWGVLFSVVLLAFAMLGYLLVGNQIRDFSTLRGSMITIVRAMFGDVDFNSAYEVAGIWGFVYLIVWLIVSNAILLNLVIAIMIEVYRVVQEEEILHPTPTRLEQILDDLRRRREEWEELRHEYDSKNPELAAEFKKPGRVMAFFFWIWTIVRERRIAAEHFDDMQDEEVEEEDVKQDEEPPPANDKPQSGEWKPWPSRVAPAPDELRDQKEYARGRK